MLVVLIALVAAGSLAAQWLDYPTPGVPRTRDGKPNLAAPAPRAANGKPDLSGIWELDHGPCPAEGCGDYPAGPEFLNMGAKLPSGLPYLPWAVRLLTFPPPRKIIQIPGELVILSERDVTFRQIFTDGRPLPVDPEPSWNGFSTAKWDGDTLVVQTIGLRDGMWLDRRGSPLSEGAKMTERFHRVNFGRLEVDLTIDDPKTYRRPWTVKLVQNIVLNTELLEYHCMDNEKDAQHAVGK